MQSCTFNELGTGIAFGASSRYGIYMTQVSPVQLHTVLDVAVAHRGIYIASVHLQTPFWTWPLRTVAFTLPACICKHHQIVMADMYCLRSTH
jgi:hypothetical protein